MAAEAHILLPLSKYTYLTNKCTEADKLKYEMENNNSEDKNSQKNDQIDQNINCVTDGHNSESGQIMNNQDDDDDESISKFKTGEEKEPEVQDHRPPGITTLDIMENGLSKKKKITKKKNLGIPVRKNVSKPKKSTQSGIKPFEIKIGKKGLNEIKKKWQSLE